jgi:hypothetical protein
MKFVARRRVHRLPLLNSFRAEESTRSQTVGVLKYGTPALLVLSGGAQLIHPKYLIDHGTATYPHVIMCLRISGIAYIVTLIKGEIKIRREKPGTYKSINRWVVELVQD